MELRHLRYFVALAETLSFTRAAERVHVTQSTLSHQIRQLEEQIGQPLFDRIGKKVVTTEAGELFLAFAARALKEVDLGLAMLQPGGGGLSGPPAHRRDAHLQHRPDPRVRGAVPGPPPDRAGAGRGTVGRPDRRPAAGRRTRHRHRLPAQRPERAVVRAAVQRGDGAGRLARRTRWPAASASAWSNCTSSGWCCCPATSRRATLLDECFQASGAEPVVVAEMSTDRADAGPGAAQRRSAPSSRSTPCRPR